MKSKFALTLSLAVGLLAIVRPASAQTFSIDWHTIGGGGGTSTGGVFAVIGTTGQPDASAQSLTNVLRTFFSSYFCPKCRRRGFGVLTGLRS